MVDFAPAQDTANGAAAQPTGGSVEPSVAALLAELIGVTPTPEMAAGIATHLTALRDHLAAVREAPAG